MRRILAFSVVFVTLVALLGLIPPMPASAASADCVAFASMISGTYSNVLYTNGQIGSFEPGDFVTISVAFGTATAGSFRIVNNPAGTVTLAGPTAIPGTLTYQVTGPLPPGSLGIGFYLDGVNGTVQVTASCQDFVPGPPIPAGFVLRTIVCDVSVFNTPGGSPVGSNRIIAGQTWYVNPESNAAPDGEAWTEIFVSGYHNGFVPTRCIQ